MILAEIDADSSCRSKTVRFPRIVRDIVVPSSPLRVANLFHRPTLIRRIPLSRGVCTLRFERHHIQRNTPTYKAGASPLQMRLSLLHALQDGAYTHQRGELLLVPVQVCNLFCEATSQDHRG